MSDYLTADLYVASPFTPDDFTKVIEEFLAAGFSPEASPGVGCLYWAYEGWYGLSPLQEAFEAFGDSPSWGLQFWRKTAVTDQIPVRLVATPPSADRTIRAGSYLALHHEPVTIVSLWVDQFLDEPLPVEDFISWTTDLVLMVRPEYGKAGGEAGLFGANPTPADLHAILTTVPQPLAWWNLFGPSYVARLGRDRLRSAPAWRVDELTEEFIAIRLGPDPTGISKDAAGAVAEHIGVPIILSRF